MMFMIGFAITVAYVYSVAIDFGLEGMDLFWELATLILTMLLGQWIEMKSVAGASKELELLVQLMPADAYMVMPDMVHEVKTDTLTEKDVILVKPGEKVAADGIILEGESYLNESMLIVESKPVKKVVGDKVIAGSIKNSIIYFHLAVVLGGTIYHYLPSPMRNRYASRVSIVKIYNLTK